MSSSQITMDMSASSSRGQRIDHVNLQTQPPRRRSHSWPQSNPEAESLLTLPPLPRRRKPIKKEEEDFWLLRIDEWFPKLDSKPYFLPPFHFHKLKRSEQTLGEIHVSVQEELPKGYEKGDAAERDWLEYLKAKYEREATAVMVVSQLNFGPMCSYKVESAVDLRLTHSLPANRKSGELDTLIISRQHGLVLCEVKANDLDGLLGILTRSQKKKFEEIAKRIGKAGDQLLKQEGVLKDLVTVAQSPETAAPVPFTKLLILPNITREELEKALQECQELRQKLYTGLFTTAQQNCEMKAQKETPEEAKEQNETPEEVKEQIKSIMTRCLCKDQRLDPLSLARKPENPMPEENYRLLVARICGQASTLEVATLGVSFPRLHSRSFGGWVSIAGRVMSEISLYPEQMELLNNPDKLVHLTGPPGTGKTVVLHLLGVIWLNEGHDVYILSTHKGSRAITFLLKAQIEATYRYWYKRPPPATVHRCHYSFDSESKAMKEGPVKAAAAFLASRARDKQLHVIIDEAGSPMRPGNNRYSCNLLDFCSRLKDRDLDLHLWAGSIYRGDNRSKSLEEKKLTVPLRCPPKVQEEVERSKRFGETIDKYSDRSSPAPTDGLEVKVIPHKGFHLPNHPKSCKQCAEAIVQKLNELQVGKDQQGLQYSDVLILCIGPSDDLPLVKHLRRSGVPVRVMTRYDDDAVYHDVALAVRDEVLVTDWELSSGLERYVVIGMGETKKGAYSRPYGMSRSTSSLIWIDL